MAYGQLWSACAGHESAVDYRASPKPRTGVCKRHRAPERYRASVRYGDAPPNSHAQGDAYGHANGHSDNDAYG